MSKIIQSQLIPARVEQVVADIVCNRCGKSCYKDGLHEGLKVHEYWGYGSRKDTDEWNADLCEDCSDAFKAWVEAAGGKIDIVGG